MALLADGRSASRYGRSTPGCISMGHRAVLGIVEKRKIPPPDRNRTPDVQVRSQWLQWLGYSGSNTLVTLVPTQWPIKAILTIKRASHPSIISNLYGTRVLYASKLTTNEINARLDTATRNKVVGLVSWCLFCWWWHPVKVAETSLVLYTYFDVLPANKTILVKKFFRVFSQVVWFCFRRHRRFEDHLCLHPQGCWVGVGLVGRSMYIAAALSDSRFPSWYRAPGWDSRPDVYLPRTLHSYIHNIYTIYINNL
jgi:hypothetical protein